MRRIVTLDADLNRFQDAVQEEFRNYERLQILGGVFIKGVAIGTGDTAVGHGLGREYLGYLVVDRNANATVYTSTTTNHLPERNLILKASSAVTVTLYVF